MRGYDDGLFEHVEERLERQYFHRRLRDASSMSFETNPKEDLDNDNDDNEDREKNDLDENDLYQDETRGVHEKAALHVHPAAWHVHARPLHPHGLEEAAQDCRIIHPAAIRETDEISSTLDACLKDLNSQAKWNWIFLERLHGNIISLSLYLYMCVCVFYFRLILIVGGRSFLRFDSENSADIFC